MTRGHTSGFHYPFAWECERISAMFAPLLLLALSSSPAPLDEHERGSYLFSACQAAIRFHDAGGSGTSGDAMESNRCISYLNGFIDGIGATGLPVFCLNGATNGTLVRVYVAYMTAHPKLMDGLIATGVTASLEDAYPCPAPPK